VLPRAWPEDRLLAKETRSVVERAIERLPPSQRTVITLRDVEGWTADEVRNALELSETNQRVLLHRARAKVRRALEQYLSEEQ
jgi:RNA polymerase sigma-70 factor (ECF subfamily)